MTAAAIVTRAQWGARYARGFAAAPLPAREVWLHHSATRAPAATATFEQDAAAVRQLDDIGQQRFGGGISYTFAVTPSGRVFEGHGVDRRGAHTKGRNSTARAIVLVGDYSNAPPTVAQATAVAWLLAYGCSLGWWVAARLAGGHRDAPGAATSCPGNGAHAAIPSINGVAARTSPLAPPPTTTRPAPAPASTDWFAMATADELRAIVRAEIRAEVPDAVWRAEVPDYYPPVAPGQAPPALPAWAALAWGTTHAARARDNAAAVHAVLAALPDQVAAAAAARGFGTGAGLTSEDVRQLVAEAVGAIGPLYLVPGDRVAPRTA